jgi:hypothetical protein
MALDERRDVRVVRPGEKISFPVTWHGAVLSLGGYDKGYTAGYTSGALDMRRAIRQDIPKELRTLNLAGMDCKTFSQI